MKKENGLVSDRKPETVDKLLDRYLSDPGSLSLEDQREIYRYFLERMNQSDTQGPEAGMLEEAIAAVDRELEKAGKGDPDYLNTPKGTYRKGGTEMKSVPVDRLIPDPDNQELFRDMEGEDFEQLKDSIREIGLIAPLIVDPEMRVICGHQRLRAVRDLGLETVQVVVRWEMEEEIRAMMAIEENIRRRQLQPSEMARAIKKLIELKGKRHKAEEVAQEVGISRSQVERYQGLSQLIPEISALLDGGKLTQAVALQIAQMDEAVQRLFYEALGDRLTQVVSEQKASEFKETHADLLNQVQDLSTMTKKLEQRKQEFEARLKELREHLDQAEFKVGDEIKAKRLLEEELEKTRAEMYQKVQEKQALIDKLKSIEPSVVPPPDYQELKAENARLKKTLKEAGPSAAKSAPPSEVLAAELHTLVTGRLLSLDILPFKGNLSPRAREQLRDIIRSLETWLANREQIVQGSGKAEKGRTGGS